MIEIAAALFAAALLVAATWRAPRLTSVLVWSLTATIFLLSAILVVAPGPFADKAIWTAIAVPVVWCAMQFFAYWLGHGRWAAGALIAITLICASIVFTTEPMV